MIHRSHLIVFLVGLLVLSGFVPMIAAAQQQGTPQETAQTNSTDTQTNSEFTLEELKQNGPRPAASPPSARDTGQFIFWIRYYPSDTPWADTSDPQDPNQKYLRTSDSIGRNSVYLRTTQPGGIDKTLTVHKVYWTTEEQVVERDENGNALRTETVLANTTHKVQEVEMSGTFARSEISLKKHNKPVRVTMWIENAPNARWTFNHKSLGTTEDAEINSVGDYWINAGQDFLIPIVFGLFIVGFGVKRAIDRAGVGPRWGLLTWGLLQAGGTFVAVVYLYRDVADLLVDLPLIASVYVILVAAIVMLETYSVGIRKYLFLKMETQHATSPSGNDALDSVSVDAETHRVIEVNGKPAIVKKGLLAFFSRVSGKAAYISNVEALDTEIKMPDSSWDRMIVVNSDSDEVIDYQQEGWKLNLPDPEEVGWVETVFKVGAFALGVYALSTVTGAMMTALGGVVIGSVLYMRPRDGYADIMPAPIHERAAVATIMNYNIMHDEAMTVQQLREDKWSLQSQNEQDVEEALDSRDSTIIEEAFGKQDEKRSQLDDAERFEQHIEDLQEDADE